MKFSARICPWFRKHGGWWYVTRFVNGKRTQQKLVKGEENEDAAFRKFHKVIAASGAVEMNSDISFNELAYLSLAWSKQNHDEKTSAWYGSFVAGFDEHYDGQVMRLRKPDSVTCTAA